jgi:hypothetical protein
MKDLALLPIVDYAVITSAFSDVCVLLLLVTLPVTDAVAVLSFSKLHLIKNYIWSSMRQDRLHASALLSTEAESAQIIKTGKHLSALHLQRFLGKLHVEEN